MNIFIALTILISGLLIWFIGEYLIHKKNLNAIPIRIHVNGTRGKSSVTRLIAAGLREGGIRTFAKTTGTVPRMIIDDGTEYPVFRHSRANIIEQLRIISFAASNQAQALIIECMALQPYLQHFSEHRMVQSTIGVITNAREDHLDVMGPEERDVALALLGTTPRNRTLITGERDYISEFQSVCRDRNTQLMVVSEEESNRIPEAEMKKFSYFEHRENVALALAVCRQVGVPDAISIKGMQRVTPDQGAMTDLYMNFYGREIFFVNGFAANDPESTLRIWQIALEKHKNTACQIMVINTRIDRPDRSRQFGIAIKQWPTPSKYILIGTGSYFLIKYAIQAGVDPKLFINAEALNAEEIFEEILSYCKNSTLIMGVGNIAGAGFELVKFFSNRSVLTDCKEA